MGLDIYFHRVTKKEVGYFRKVNFLVKYFEDYYHIEDMQSFQPVEVTKEIAEDLLDRCNKVLENPDLGSELLPTRSGFFFGGTEYNEFYLDDVKSVHDYLIEELIPMYEELGEHQYIDFLIWY